MTAKATQPVDINVGGIIRHQRKILGLSQKALASQLGVSFQQVQKYERGTNRVSASRLHQIAKVLGLPVADLFGAAESEGEVGGRDAAEGTRPLFSFISTSEALDLNRAFLRVTSPKVRQRVIDLVRQIALDQIEATS